MVSFDSRPSDILLLKLLDEELKDPPRKVSPKMLSVRKEMAGPPGEDEIIDEEEESKKKEKRFSGKFAGIEDILARKEKEENCKDY